ncbi:ankyrin repeat-containing domain protein [Dendryphion nanum]|uniref:Ankyrin repeat-containing domain protein n=1 Tax=Dendryphion nanum TaxID=256645 RepID=A0A9P9IHL2_9PLEO|nr:ankyrin repeat-containing domain protein [Dendryphion nanum]
MTNNTLAAIKGTTVLGAITDNRGVVLHDASGHAHVIGSQTNNYFQPGKSQDQPTSTLVQASRRKKFLQSLEKSPYQDRKDRNTDRVLGTCDWFVSHKVFLEWQESKSSKMLWVSADPGCGKSVLAKHLIDSVLPTTESRTVCYFFFKDDFEDQRSVVSALCCILHQLFKQKSDLLSDAVLDQFDIEGETFTPSFNRIWDTLINAAKEENAGEIICVLDAIDECDNQGKSLTQKLCQLSGTGSNFNLKFLLTSRPYGVIRRNFQPLQIEGSLLIHLRGEGDSEMVKISQEIDVFIRARVQDVGKSLMLEHDEQNFLLKRLLRVPNRTYLWVHLTLDLIQSDLDISKTRIHEATSRLPETVDEAYDKILSKSSNSDKAKKILHIIVAAERPLTLREMTLALVIQESHRSYGDLELEPEGRFREKVRDICGLFVTIIDSRIYLLHQTAKEFLIQDDAANSPKNIHTDLKWKHSLRLQESHRILADICTWYLLLNNFDDRPLGENKTLFEHVEHHVFLDYSAKHWATHFRKLQIDVQGAMTQSILKICEMSSQRCMVWFRIYWTITNTDFPKGFTSLMIVSYFGLSTAVGYLVKMDGIDSNSQDDTYRRSALSWAVRQGFDAVVKVLINDASIRRRLFKRLSGNSVNIDSVDIYGRTPLSYAVWVGNVAIVKLLIKAGARADSKDEIGGTPLSYAICNGHKEVTELLLKRNAEDGLEGIIKKLLLSAAEKGDEDVFRLLLDTGKANLDARDNNRQTPMITAARNGHWAIVKLLIATGKIDVNAKSKHNWTPLSWAVERGEMDMIDLLLKVGAKFDDEYTIFTPLCRAAENGYDIVVKRLLLEADKVNVNWQNQAGWAPLSYAVEEGHKNVVELLLNAGANTEYEYIIAGVSKVALSLLHAFVALIANPDVCGYYSVV